MRAYDHANLVLLEEPVDDIGTVAHDVVDSGVLGPVLLIKHRPVSHRVEERPQALEWFLYTFFC